MSTRSAASELEHGATPWLLVAALATSAPHVEHLPIWLSLLTGAALGWRTWLWHRHGRLPHQAWLALLVVGCIGGIGWQYRTLFGRDAGVALLVLFMALKPLEMSRRRDALVIVMLGYFLLLTHYFYSQSIPTGGWLLLVTGWLTATLIRLYGGAQPLPQIARQALVLLAQALPLMLVLYLLFPRISGPLWGLPQDAHAGLSGLSDRLTPGSISHLIQSGAIAFRSRFVGEVPEHASLYWRGPVFDEYDGLTWRLRATPASERPAPPVIDASAPAQAYTTILEAHNQRWLLALDMPTELPANSAFGPGLEVLAREPLRARARFSFSSVLTYRVNQRETPTVLQHALRLPAQINPRTRALATSWRALPPERIAEAALDLFRRENFVYTLRPPLLGTDAMDDFLFVTRSGFCEHYASAFVFLMRAAGVPARVVAGYQGGEINPVDGYLTVRQSDAHAWSEVWLAGQGWVRVDPTAAVAPSRVEQGIAAALPDGDPLPAVVRLDADWARQMRNRWEAANNAWNQWVLGYNPQRQREVLSRLGLRQPDWQEMTAALALFSALTLIAVTWWTLPRRRRRDAVQSAWQGFCAGLARHGITRADWEGPLDFAERVAREKPELAALATAAASHYAELRYGLGDPRQLQHLQECVRRIPKPRRRTI